MVVRPWARVSAALAPVFLIGGWTVAAARQPGGFDQVERTISALAATGTPDRWVMTAALAATGACHVVTAAGLRAARPAGRLVLALGGVAIAGVAALPQPATGHEAVAAVSFGALTLWPVLARTPTPRAAVLASAGLAVLLVGFGVSLSVDSHVGLTERLLAGAQALWPAAVAFGARTEP